MRRDAPGIVAPAPMMQKANRGIDRAIRKAGQLHGDDRRAYEAAKAQGRGQGFMRDFQRQAGQTQQQMGQEAQRAGFRPSMPPQSGMPQRQPQMRPPDRNIPLQQPPPQYNNWNDVQPMPRPMTGGGQPPENIDPGFNQWQQLPQIFPPGQRPGMAYMGGSPNFNESTGQYQQPGATMGGSPQQFQQNFQNQGLTPNQQLMNQRYGGGY